MTREIRDLKKQLAERDATIAKQAERIAELEHGATSLDWNIKDHGIAVTGVAAQVLAIPEADNEFLGKKVREVWLTWAQEQPDPKPSWLLPWDRLSPADRDVDTRIGTRLANIGRCRYVDVGSGAHQKQLAERDATIERLRMELADTQQDITQPGHSVVDEDAQQGNCERYSLQGRRMTRCHSDDDGHCDWLECPQLRDKEPAATGRHCPLDKRDED